MEKKTGLIVEGGGVRGLYAAGILDVLLENRVFFDGVIGVSAGAIHGSSFTAGQLGRTLYLYKTYIGDRRFMSIKNFICTGELCDGEFCYHELQEKLVPFDYKAFEKAKTEFYVVCTNLEQGKAEYIRITDMKSQIDYLRASASLPFLSRPVEGGGKKLLDGGCCDSIPFSAFQRMGFNRNVVILTRQYGYVKKPVNGLLIRMFYGKYPAFMKAMKNRHIVYNDSLKKLRQQEEGGQTLVLRPSVKPNIGRFTRNPLRLQEVYDMGRRDGKASLEAVKLFLSV